MQQPEAAAAASEQGRRLAAQWGASSARVTETLLQVMSKMQRSRGSGSAPHEWQATCACSPHAAWSGTLPPALGAERLRGAAFGGPALAMALSDGASSNSDFVRSTSTSEEWRQVQSPGSTTLMVRNIPSEYTEDMLLEEWPAELGYDLFYLPRTKKGHANVGYAFINFVSESRAGAFRDAWDKRRLARFSAAKRLNISLAEVQGLEANIRMLRRKPVNRMRARQCQPIIVRDGQQGRLELDAAGEPLRLEVGATGAV